MKMLMALACLMAAGATAVAQDNTWKPIDAAQLSMTAPAVEKDADAEILLWEVTVDFGSNKTTFSNYVRVKIFTERGKELHGKVELPYYHKNKVEGIAARTIKPDGTVAELNNAAIFERTIIKRRGIKISAKSFALPAVETGAIIEYRWREVRPTEFFLRLPLQQRYLPIHSLNYFLKGSSEHLDRLTIKTFNGQDEACARENKKLCVMSLKNIPAFREEPLMPPEDQVRKWALVYSRPYTLESVLYVAHSERFKSATALNDELRKTAAAVTGDAQTSEQKLRRLFEFCRSKIKNVDVAASGFTEEDLARLKDNKTAADTLRRGSGTSADINVLFASLALAAGFDARLALVGDRSDIFFTPRDADMWLQLYFLSSTDIAVLVDGLWRFFDPGSAYVPYGMLLWQEESLTAVLLKGFNEEFERIPLSPAEKSLHKRTAKLRLSEDGTLEGDVQIDYSGHPAIERRIQDEAKSPDDRERLLREQISARLSTAELSGVKIENVFDPTKPLVYSFHVRVPGYAQRTGRRLFLQPAFFQKGVPPLFTAGERRHAIYFHYPWSEQDDVEIELPAGFELDNAESVGSFPLGASGKYEGFVGITKDKRKLVYRRNFAFGINGGLMFNSSDYAQLKKIHDVMHELDNHTITLKQAAGNKPD